MASLTTITEAMVVVSRSGPDTIILTTDLPNPAFPLHTLVRLRGASAEVLTK